MNSELSVEVAPSTPGMSHQLQDGTGTSNRHSLRASFRRKLYLSRAKLKASRRTSALLSGFVMVAMVEVHLEMQYNYPRTLLVGFSVCTSVLMAVYLFALLISMCILPNVEAVSNIQNRECMHCYIELAWGLSTVLGILLFLVDVVLVYWIKFLPVDSGTVPKAGAQGTSGGMVPVSAPGHTGWQAALTSTIIMVPVGFIFIIFTVHFYSLLVRHKMKPYDQERQQDELEHGSQAV